MSDLINIDTIRKNLKAELDLHAAIFSENTKDIIVYGAGNTALLYEKTFTEENIVPLCFVDGNPNKAKSTFLFQKKVITINEIDKVSDNPLILICAGKYNSICAIKKSLSENGYTAYTVDDFVFTKNSEKVLAVFDLLKDEQSKQTYADLILARMGRRRQNPDFVCQNQYFGLDIFTERNGSEVFVDCGAYVGDSVESYISIKAGMFGKCFAFEPDAANFKALSCRTERIKSEWALNDDRIILVNAGVGAESARLAMRNSDSESSLGAAFTDNISENGISVYKLDDYFKGSPVGFIKADIEGFEEKMLTGADKMIKANQPLLAICIYHNPTDMYKIPLMLTEKYNFYSFSVRQHYYDINETVLYAYKVTE